MEETSTADDRDAVARLLGRQPAGGFRVALRRVDGAPVVIENAPLLDDGTPMPTLFWLVDPDLTRRVSRLEADGGVRQAAETIGEDAIAAAHEHYRVLRSQALEPGQTGPLPSGGVGGTRRGVKCLHAHFAWFLVGGPDPVGRWTSDRIGANEADVLRGEND